MLANSILVLITLFVLYFLGMLWLRHALLNDLRELSHKEAQLMKDYEKRRDQVPLLLESIRQQEQPSDGWRKLVADRAFFHTQSSRSAEENFAKTLNEFLRTTSIKSLDFLEAKKSIEDLSALIEHEKQELKIAAQSHNVKRKQFPFSLASAIFGFRELDS